MSDEKSFDELQSKTVLLEDNDGVDDMLSALNTGRVALDKKKKEQEREKLFRKIAVVFAVTLIVVAATVVVMKLL